MVRTCFLCSTIRKADITLFKFPSQGHIRDKWFDACGLDKNVDVVKNLYICLSHFQPEDLKAPDWKQLGVRPRLKSTAVPSKRKTKKIFFHSSIDTSETLEPTTSCPTTSHFQFVKIEIPESLELTDSYPSTSPTMQSACTTENAELLDPIATCPSTSFSLQSTHTIENTELLEPIGVCPSTSPRLQSAHTTDSKTGGRIVHEARYPSELCEIDFSSSKQIKRMIALIKDFDQKKTLTIRRLQDQNRYLRKRLETLKSLVSNIKKQNITKQERETHNGDKKKTHNDDRKKIQNGGKKKRQNGANSIEMEHSYCGPLCKGNQLTDACCSTNVRILELDEVGNEKSMSPENAC